MLTFWEPELDAVSAHWREVAEHHTAEVFAPRAEELDREGRYPWESVEVLVESGLAAPFIPREYGGQSLPLVAVCAVGEAVSRGCASTGAILSAYALGAVPIILAGTEEQKARYLPEVVAGRAVSFALTEVGAGSDAAAIRTTAIREDDGWRLQGEKIYIGNGGASQYYIVFAQAQGDDGTAGVTAFMVDKDAPGVVIDRYEDKMGIRGTLTSNLKLDTVVPPDAVLGQLGKGLRLALQTLNIGRISVAAQSSGVALAALDAGVAEATRRTTFGKPIIEHQGIGFQLADVATRVTAARMLTYEAARRYDAGGDVSMLGAMAKLDASEAAKQAADVAVQVFGGEGYCRPCIAERLYRDQRILQIYEGTSEIQRLVISRKLAAEVASGEKVELSGTTNRA